MRVLSPIIPTITIWTIIILTEGLISGKMWELFDIIYE